MDPLWLARRLQALFPTTGEMWFLPPISPDPLADVVLARFGKALGRLTDYILPAPQEIEGAYAAARRLAEGLEGIEAISLEQFRGWIALFWPVRMVVEVLPRLSDSAAPQSAGAAQAALDAAACWMKETARVLSKEVATAWLGAWF